MPIQLDIAGNFGRGAQVRHTARLARQLERANDYELAGEADKLGGRRDAIRQAEEIYGLDPYDFGDFQTNPDPLGQRLMQWWKQRRQLRGNGRSFQPPPGDFDQVDGFSPGPTPLEEIPGYGYANGGSAIPRYAEGGSVADEEAMARRRRLLERVRRNDAVSQKRFRDPLAGRQNAEAAFRRTAVPGVDSLKQGTAEIQAEQRRRAAQFRRQGIDTRRSQTSLREGPAGPRGTPGTAGRALPRESLMRRTTNALRGRGASAAGRARGVGAGALVGFSAIAPQLTDENYDDTMERRFGFEADADVQPGGGENGMFLSGDAGDASLGGFLKYFGKRALGYASDVGSTLTFGLADKFYRDNQQAIPDGPGKVFDKPSDQAAQPEPPPETPVTPDEAIAQAAKKDGQRMVEEADAANAPPGAIDFSKVNVPPSEIPAFPVKDWTEYRARAVRNAMLQGASPTEAHQQVSQLQMNGFTDYMQQAMMHIESGNPLAAASAARAAYQYFPNGSDIRVGVTKGQDGNPVVVAMGVSEETGEPVGSPQVLSSERIAAMVHQAKDPAAWNAWTKDWRDERFQREQQNFEEQKAEHAMGIAERNAASYERMAEAQYAGATRQRGGAAGRTQADDDRAYAAFAKRSEMLALNDPAKADKLNSVMAQIYEQVDWPYLKVIEFVNELDARGQLDAAAQQLGIE